MDIGPDGLASFGEGHVERLDVGELVAQDLRGERVEQLLICVREVRNLVVGELLDGSRTGITRPGRRPSQFVLSVM